MRLLGFQTHRPRSVLQFFLNSLTAVFYRVLLSRETKARQYARSLLFSLLTLLLCAPMFAIDRDRRIEQLYHTSWTFKDGIPGEIHSLAQTSDGYLWLGTATGLFRFDGVRCQQYEPRPDQTFPQHNVFSLLAVPGGGLWVGFWYGGVSFLRDGIVTNYGVQDGLPSHAILAFAKDQQGVIWAAAGIEGLARLEGSRWRKIGTEWRFPGAASTVFVDHSGTLWVGTPDSVFFLPKGGKEFQKAADHLANVSKLAEASDGTLWMAETGRAVRPVPFPKQDPNSLGPEVRVGSQAMLLDNRGSLWVASLGDGLRRIPYPERLGAVQIERFSPTAEIYTESNGLSGDNTMAILQDREGNIWVGTSVGLDRFRQSSLVPVSVPPGTVLTGVVAGDHGVVWAAGMSRSILMIHDGEVTDTQTLPLHHVDSAYRDPDGVIWIASPFQLLRFADEQLHPIGSLKEHISYDQHSGIAHGGRMVLRAVDLPKEPEPVVTPQTRVRAITKDLSGRLWISISGKGVFRLEGRSWTNLESLGGPKGTAISEFTDVGGRIWFGFGNNTVAVLNGDKVQTFSSKNGLLSGNVLSIQGEGQNIWIGGDDGLALYDGSHFRSIIPSDRSVFTGVSGIVAISGDGLWFSQNNGIIHVPETELRVFRKNPAYRVTIERFDLLDGLNAQLQRTHVSPSAIRATDGLLWFATNEGLTWIDPKRILKNTVPPLVTIESILANTQDYALSEPSKLPAHTTNLRIAYTALSLTIPERVRFRYRLDGLEKEWQDAGTRREAFYTNLGPGKYRFHVMACNNDGVWNEVGASLGIVIAPAWYQTVWFKLLCILATIGFILSLYLLRLRQLTAQVQGRLSERLVERERIARELHDTLLQSFQGLVLRFQGVLNHLPDHEPARQVMERALDRADEVLIEGRLRVRDLRPESATVNELPAALAICGEELAQDHEIHFSLAVVGEPRSLNPVVLDEAYGIGREALINAFHHSLASKIETEITYDYARLRLRIRDDGDGIDQKILASGRTGHWGLSGMRERTQTIGGQLNIWSSPGLGTEVDLTVPATIAYGDTRKRTNWSWIVRAIRRRRTNQ
jgi:signal transduction histidine kinase/ligand-binding sensor domain-containing protein